MMAIEFSFPLMMAVGDRGAVLLQFIRDALIENDAKREHVHFHQVWMPMSFKGFHEALPFLSIKIVRNTLAQLQQDGYIDTDFLAEHRRTRIKYYTLTPKGWALLESPS